MCKKTLYLHIGSEKCASTTLQNAIFPNTGLARYRATILKNWGKRNSWKLAAAFGGENARTYWVKTRNLHDDQIEKIRTDIYRDTSFEIQEKKSEGIYKFIASSEYIFNQVNDKSKIENLRKFLADFFEEIFVVFYYRNQASLAPSLWAQRVKGPTRSSRSFGDFLSDKAVMDNPIFTPYSLLKTWQANFDGLYFNTIDRENLEGKNVITDFSGYMCIDLNDNGNCVRSNVSPPPLVLQVMRCRNFMQRKWPNAFSKSVINFGARVSIRLFKSVDKRGLSSLQDKDLPRIWRANNADINADFLRQKPIKLPT